MKSQLSIVDKRKIYSRSNKLSKNWFIMSVFFLTILIILFNLIFYFKFNVISKLAFFDKPDGKLKRHSNPTSLIGGLVILWQFTMMSQLHLQLNL